MKKVLQKVSLHQGNKINNYMIIGILGFILGWIMCFESHMIGYCFPVV